MRDGQVSRAPWLLLLAAVVVLGTALASQYVGGLQPCVLCVYQRWPYVAVIVLAAAATLLPGRKRFQGGLLVLAGLALLVGAGIAVFHVGVEQHWWAGTSECGGAAADLDSVDALRAQLMDAPIVRCDEPAWTMLGVSMAGYNVLVSAVLAIAAFAAGFRLLRRPGRLSSSAALGRVS